MLSNMSLMCRHRKYFPTSLELNNRKPVLQIQCRREFLCSLSLRSVTLCFREYFPFFHLPLSVFSTLTQAMYMASFSVSFHFRLFPNALPFSLPSLLPLLLHINLGILN